MKEEKAPVKEEKKMAHTEPVNQNDFKAMFSMAADMSAQQDADKKAKKSAKRKNQQNFV